MKILISFASNSGGTMLASEIIKTALTKHMVVSKRAADTHLLEFKDYDLIILGSPSWFVNGQEGQMQESMIELLGDPHFQNFSGKPFAVFGCGDRSYTDFCAAVDKLADYVNKTGGELIAEPLKIDGYFFALEENERQVNNWANQLLKKIKTLKTL